MTKHYNLEAKAIELISNGDISALYGRCDKPEGHTFENPVKGCTTYYGRDRGEEGTELRVGNWEEERNSEEFGYLYEDGEWKWTCSYYKSLKELRKDQVYSSFEDSFIDQEKEDLKEDVKTSLEIVSKHISLLQEAGLTIEEILKKVN